MAQITIKAGMFGSIVLRDKRLAADLQPGDTFETNALHPDVLTIFDKEPLPISRPPNPGEPGFPSRPAIDREEAASEG